VKNSHLNKRLQYKHEILHARQELRELHLHRVVKEVYENIGQVLSLVRMQLGTFEPLEEKKQKEIEISGTLVEQAIVDLKKMCRGFDSHFNLFTMAALAEAIRNEITIYFSQSSSQLIKINGMAPEGEPEINLIFFSIVLGIFDRLKCIDTEIVNAEINFGDKRIDFIIDHTASSSTWWIKEKNSHKKDCLITLPLSKKVKLISGSLKIKKINSQMSRIKLTATL